MYSKLRKFAKIAKRTCKKYETACFRGYKATNCISNCWPRIPIPRFELKSFFKNEKPKRIQTRVVFAASYKNQKSAFDRGWSLKTQNRDHVSRAMRKHEEWVCANSQVIRSGANTPQLWCLFSGIISLASHPRENRLTRIEKRLRSAQAILDW